MGILMMWAVLWWALLGLCSAGNRPILHRFGPRGPRPPMQHDQGEQRVQYPSVEEQEGQRVHYPSASEQGGQRVQYPSVNDQSEPSVDIWGGGHYQRCARGYYRESSGPNRGQCVRCFCNELSNDCDEATGRCLNCQYNTGGHRCERCKDGYYGNAALRTCHVCPCPLASASNSFAIGCREVNGDFECVCRQGYSGARCERCAPGYYGDPMAQGGTCRPCNCNGNPRDCDPRTGACNNSLDPKDTDTDQQCQECDNCVQTLLIDLERIDRELLRLKGLLQSANASSEAQQRLKKLEDAIEATKALLDRYSSSVNDQRSKISQLEQEVQTIGDDIQFLKEKANNNADKAQEAMQNIDGTNRKAKELLSESQKLFAKIQELLKQLNQTQSNGSSVPSGELAKMLADAERMVREMRNRNCASQLQAAQKEKEEAQKLLDYIKNNVTKRQQENQEAAKRIADLLMEYDSKLKDLEEALEEANNTVKKATQQNDISALTLEELRKRAEDMKVERDKVANQIAMAKDQLKSTKDLLKMLEDSKKEYEELAAQLDGAKTDLTKKVNLLSLAAAKEDIVVKAEKHAEMLNQLAKDLEEAVRNASSSTDVRNAMDAIDAYRNITDAVKAAEEAANRAKDAAEKALKDVNEQNLTKRAQDLNDDSTSLLDEAKSAEKELELTNRELDTQKKRLNKAKNKKENLNNDLRDVQAELDDIKKDNVSDIIDAAKKTAASANGTANDVLQRLQTIQEEVDKINIQPTDTNFDKILNDVNGSLANLTNTIPTLLDKISEVEELTSQLVPGTNISENIKRIKELIELTRDAADRVVVPMRFSGDSYVELRPPADLEDLKAYTSLTLSLQRPPSRGDGKRKKRQIPDTKTMFVLYLGNKNSSKDYIGMYLLVNQLIYVYKLNGKVYEVKSSIITESPYETSFFDRVNLHRAYEDAEVVFTKLYTSTTPDADQTSTQKGDLTYNLLNIDPNDVVFYVGGYPDDFTPPPPLNLPKYQGCIEFSSFNEQFISLYNFKNAVGINKDTPCRRFLRTEGSWYFEGTGYARMDIADRTLSRLLLQQMIDTRTENAVLLYLGNEDSYYSITVERGYVVFRGRDGNTTLETVKTKSKYFPLGKETEFFFGLFQGKPSFVRLNGELALTDLNLKRGVYESYYIGGVPTGLRERDNIVAPPLKGCVKNVKVDQSFRAFAEKVGVSPGCPTDFLTSRKAELSLGSSLMASLPGFQLTDGMTVSLGFWSLEQQARLLEDSQGADRIELSLVNGFVVFKFNDRVWKSRNTYADGNLHYLTATKNGQNMQLWVDERDAAVEQPSTTPLASTAVNLTLGRDTFQGCLKNLYTRRPDMLYRPEDLSVFTYTGDVLMDVCAADPEPLLMLAGADLGNSTPEKAKVKAGEQNLEGCTAPESVSKAYQLGFPTSYLSYNISAQTLWHRPHFSLDVRTKAANGLLFYVGSSRGQSHLALYMHRGRIRLAMGPKEIFIKEKYNNGKWHSVIFTVDERKFRLVVDGLHAKDGQLTHEDRLSLDMQSPVYLGSVPAFARNNLQGPFPTQSIIGCIRNFKLNGFPATGPTTNHGAAPCFDGPSENGAYFSGNGGYAVIDRAFVVGINFELVFEVRPRNTTGLLFHVGKERHHLSLFMRNGEVVVQVNNGAGQFGVSVTPQQSLCDGTMHRIAVFKQKNVVQLDVDTEGQYTVGPSSSSHMGTRDPLYMGGVPETWQDSQPLVTAPFVGCLQDVRINSERVSFDKVADVWGPVNLRECPAG